MQAPDQQEHEHSRGNGSHLSAEPRSVWTLLQERRKHSRGNASHLSADLKQGMITLVACRPPQCKPNGVDPSMITLVACKPSQCKSRLKRA